MHEDNIKKYHELFPDEKSKAAAFDQIAAKYYWGNFGTMTKADFEILIFSIYIERMLENEEEAFIMGNDYILSKLLGIPQSRVSNLKVKKHLQYPHPFDWKEAFLKLSSNARFENGKIKINIPDKNLFYELQNAIEQNGGFIEKQLTASLLQVSPEYYIDIVLVASQENDRKELLKQLRAGFRKAKIDTEYLESQSVGSFIKENAPSAGADLIVNLLGACIPAVGIGTALGGFMKVGINLIKASIENKKTITS